MIASDNLEQRAFMFFVERVDMALRDRGGVGLLIGDFEHDRASTVAATDLSQFRESGTPYDFGRAITHLIDTVHFTHSHLSRMVQLADVYIWTLQLCASTPPDEPGPRGELARFVREETRLLRAHRFKEWPSTDSWIRVGNARSV